MSQEIDYTTVLADLEAKRAKYDAAIAVVRDILGLDSASVSLAENQRPVTASAQGASIRPQDIGPGTFHSMSVSEAAKKFLEMTKQKQKTTIICAALRAGGIESSARNFYGNVYSTLSRTNAFIRIGSSWALADWYPSRSTTTVPRKGKKKAKKSKAAQKAERTPPKGAEVAEKLKTSETEKVKPFLKKGPKAAVAAQ